LIQVCIITKIYHGGDFEHDPAQGIQGIGGHQQLMGILGGFSVEIRSARTGRFGEAIGEDSV
jgi:hypothetical protein